MAPWKSASLPPLTESEQQMLTSAYHHGEKRALRRRAHVGAVRAQAANSAMAVARTIGLVTCASLVGLAVKASVSGLAVQLPATVCPDGKIYITTTIVTAVVLGGIHRTLSISPCG